MEEIRALPKVSPIK
jgi:hypothetical protein